MSISKYHGQTLEISVNGCTNLKDLEWFTKQDPYVIIEYGSSRFRTKTCRDGGRNPTFQQKFLVSLIDGIKEMNLQVWNSNTFTAHQLIGTGKIHLQELINNGIDDRSWTIFDERNKPAGEVRLFLYCSSMNKTERNPDGRIYTPPSPFLQHSYSGSGVYPTPQYYSPGSPHYPPGPSRGFYPPY